MFWFPYWSVIAIKSRVINARLIARRLGFPSFLRMWESSNSLKSLDTRIRGYDGKI